MRVSFWSDFSNCDIVKSALPWKTKFVIVFSSLNYATYLGYTANVCRDLQGLCRGFLQYLQGKSCNIYRFSLQYLQIAEIAEKLCKYYRIFPADILENPCRVPVNPCKHLQCNVIRFILISWTRKMCFILKG